MIKKYFDDFRTPNDIDWITNDESEMKKSIVGKEEYYYMPFSPDREMTVDEILENRSMLSKNLSMSLKETTDIWGVLISSVNISNLTVVNENFMTIIPVIVKTFSALGNG